jgi:hypothetical protein
VDLETDDDCEIARDVTIDHNSFGANHYGVVASVGFGGNPQVGDVTVTDNVQTAPTGLGPPATGECWAPVRILSPDGLYRGGYTFRGNHFLARWNGFEFRRVNNVAVDANTVDYGTASGCSAGAGVLMVDSHTVAITNNLFNGADQVFTADAASTNIDAQGNTTTTSSGGAPTATAGPTATAAPTATEPTPQGEAPEAPPSSEEQNPSPTGEPPSPRATEPTVPAGSGGEQPADAHGPGHHSRAPGAVGP